MIRFIKILIWLYLALLVFEGALRKWIFPGLAEPLLIVRDPVVILIYLCALAAGVFPRNAWAATLGIFAVLAVLFATLAGQNNLLVTAYGLRTDFLHVPLIWVMTNVLDRRDVERLGLAILALAILMMLLMVQQFRSPMESWINRGVGGDDNGQIYGAAGHIRPPGFFAFITGPMSFFALAMAFFLQFVTRPIPGRFTRLRWCFVLLAGAAIVIALPLSISRGTMINTGLVVLTFIGCSALSGMGFRGFIRTTAAAAVLVTVLSFLPVFKEARNAFLERWDSAASQSAGDAWGSLGTRIASGFTEPITSVNHAAFFGAGIGVGSNVGGRLLAGRMQFSLGENEWKRSIMELGPLLGAAFILFRCALAIMLFVRSWRALRRGHDPLPLLIWTAAAPIIVLQQWAPPTLLGFAVFGGGLILAATNYPPPEETFEPDETNENEKLSDPVAPSRHELERRRMRGIA